MNAVGKWVAGILAAVITAVLSAVLIQRFASSPDEAGTPAEASNSAAQPAQGPPPGLGGASKIFLNRDSGPAGTQVRVSGQGFASGEDVVILFHAENVAHTSADDQGGFADVSVHVPTDWQFTGQFAFVATGESSIKSARREFRVT